MKSFQQSHERRTGRWGRVYPWERWFAKDHFTLTRGKDFRGRTYAMGGQVRNWVAKHLPSVRVSVRIAKDGESLQVKVFRH